MKMKKSNEAKAKAIVRRYTAIAAGTGAIPLPAGSAAVVAEQAAMITHVAATYGKDVTLATIAKTMPVSASLNVAGRALFVEGMRAINVALGGSGTPFVCALGSATAGVQMWIVRNIAIAIAENGGAVLSNEKAGEVIELAKRTYPASAA